jgi:hypothetical protein
MVKINIELSPNRQQFAILFFVRVPPVMRLARPLFKMVYRRNRPLKPNTTQVALVSRDLADSAQLVNANRCVSAADRKRNRRLNAVQFTDGFLHRFWYEKARVQFLVQLLDAKRDVNNVANHSVFASLAGTDISDQRLARMQSDSNPCRRDFARVGRALDFGDLVLG